MKKNIGWFIDNSEEVLAGILLMATVLLLFSQVILRYFFGRSIAWTEEMSRYTFMWMVYIAASLAAKQDTHIRVTAQLTILPVKARNVVLLLADLLWLSFNAVVVWEGIGLFSNMSQFRLVSGSMGWDLRWVFLILPIAFFAMSVRIIQVQYRRFRGLEHAVVGGEREI